MLENKSGTTPSTARFVTVCACDEVGIDELRKILPRQRMIDDIYEILLIYHKRPISATRIFDLFLHCTNPIIAPSRSRLWPRLTLLTKFSFVKFEFRIKRTFVKSVLTQQAAWCGTAGMAWHTSCLIPGLLIPPCKQACNLSIRCQTGLICSTKFVACG